MPTSEHANANVIRIVFMTAARRPTFMCACVAKVNVQQLASMRNLTALNFCNTNTSNMAAVTIGGGMT